MHGMTLKQNWIYNMFQVQLKPKAYKQLCKLQQKDQKKISIAIDQIAHDPFVGKKLEGELMGLWSVRVWPYRIVYTIQKKKIIVTIVAIGDRKNVYKKL